MKRRTQIIVLTAISAVAIFAAACPQRRSIADLEADPGRYANKEVAIAGVVRDSYGLSVPGTPIRGGVYKVDDGTGSIWVVTENTVPAKGSEIGVSGTLGNGVTWKGRNYGLGIYEKDRRFRKR
ncbi:MAG: hypothetical protein ACK4S4_09640 [Pyrinomonadaceae bacterium]